MTAGGVDPPVELAEGVEHGAGEELDVAEVEEEMGPPVSSHHLADFLPEVVKRGLVDEPTFENPHDIHGAVAG